jgi:hypothetical protein
MGNSASKKQKELSEFIQWQQNCHYADPLTLFRQEFQTILSLWDNQKLFGKHFDKCTFLLGRIDNDDLKDSYKNLITQWNLGKTETNDFLNVAALL